MMKKIKHFSFRTTEQNLNYLKLISELDDRSQSYILNKMIDVFRERGCFTIEQIDLIVSDKSLPCFAINDGFVVTPFTNPVGISSSICLMSAVSTKNFIDFCIT